MSTESLAEDWARCVAAVERARSLLRRVESDLVNAQNALGKHLDPGDMTSDETICVWARLNRKQERLFAVKKSVSGSYRVKIRGRIKEEAP